jgi:hypothetical protein
MKTNTSTMMKQLPSLVAAVALVGTGCTTFNTARPLKPGEHAAAVTVGGVLADVPGVATIPLPNVTVEGRHGFIEHLDVNYGVHLLPTLFGAAGGHVGSTFQLYDAPHPLVPVVAVGQRFFFFTNIFDTRKVDKDAWAMSQTDVTASWDVYGSLVYGGVTAYVPIDIEDRTLHLAPFAGLEIHPGVDWLRLQVEGRWLSPTTDTRYAVVNYVGPNDNGAFALNAGVAVEFTELFAAIVNGGKEPPPEVSDVTEVSADTTTTTDVGAQP